jgi:hypothetical protein
MMTVRFSDRVRIAPEIMFREVGDESVILDLRSERYLGLNDVGTRMWHALMGSGSIQTAYEVLLANYDVEPAELERDLRELVDQLVEMSLITIGPESE